MGSDRARVSHDPGRHWRAVISQQGRVALEADANEATAIALASGRAELLEVIGPAGTPVPAPGDEGGYFVAAVDAGGTFNGDLSVTPGTIYVGGERATLDAAVNYGAQPDWLDTTGDPLWVPAAVPAGGSGNEIVYLLLREQEVTAVEDPALRDVALGGPDTSARLRVIQRIVRQATDQASGSAPFADPHLVSQWASLGLSLDPAKLRLRSAARLQVQGEYVGAENQLIRVQIASVDGSGNPTLVWGFDNAYHVYRVTPAATGNTSQATVLELIDAPVDVYHQPVAGQTVEVLQSAAQLSTSDTFGFIAATTGFVTTLTPTGGYQPDSGRVVLSAPISLPAAGSPPLFLRVWQGTAVLSAGSAALGQTGLQVMLSLTPAAQGAPAPTYHVGDYWTFAVRPGTSAPIYPERIAQSPQAAEGPSLWACPLAFVQWSAGKPSVSDCRRPFDNLVDTLAALTSNDRQGTNFPLALQRLFGRGVISGLIPSINVTPPATGATSAQVTVTTTPGALIDGRGAVIAPGNLTLQDTVPLSFSQPGTLADTKRWLYLVTDASETPSLQLRATGPVGGLNLPQDVAAALTDPTASVAVAPNETGQQSQADAWRLYGDVPAVDPTITDPAVCLGVIGVEGAAGWTTPNDRQQLFPTPAITSANWQQGRHTAEVNAKVYETVMQAFTAKPANLKSILLAPGNQPLNGQVLLGGTLGRKVTIQLDNQVFGNAVTVTFQSTPGVTVHGPVAIAPGASSVQVTFDITAASGAQSITAVIPGGQLQASFTAVQVGTPTLAGGAAAVMSGDPIDITVAMPAATEPVIVTLTAPNTTFNPATLQLAAGATSGKSTLTVTPPTTGQIVVVGVVQTADGTKGTAPPNVQFSAVSLGTTINISPSPVTVGTPSNGTITLSAAAPYGIQIAISVDDQTVLTVSPSLLAVAQGATSVPAFQLTPLKGGQVTVTAGRTAQGAVRQTVAATLGVVKPKESKETKDAKDGKDVPKDHKDGKDGKDGGKDQKDVGTAKDQLIPAAIDTKTHVDTVTPLVPLSDPEDREAPIEEPEGRAFVRPALRPTLGRGAFDSPDGDGQR